jgi:predicted GNAT superfamily acetyltransferase
MLEEIVVKKLHTIEQFQEMQKLEHEIWNQASTSVKQLIAVSSNGGIVLGAYKDTELVGINYAFPAFQNGETYLYSLFLGVKRKYREQGIGELLKIHIKEYALEAGYEKCLWVFDPLESRNAYLNFTKLRAYAYQYIPNFYGELEDPFSINLPTDRLFICWYLNDSDYLRWDEQMDEFIESASEIVPWQKSIAGLPVLDPENQFDAKYSYINESYLLAVPTNFQKLKVENPALAEDWRYKTRAILMAMFSQGYAITKLVRKDQHVNMYVFVKKSLLAI